MKPVEGPGFTVTFSPDEALVLSDWLWRLEMTDLGGVVDDAAVWAPLHRISRTLDTTLPDIFAPDYAARLEAARDRLRPEPDPEPEPASQDVEDDTAG